MVSMNAQIEMFCQKYQVDARKIYHIQLVLEELLLVIFGEYYADVSPQISLSIEFAEEGEEISISLHYASQHFNPFQLEIKDEDHLGITIVKNLAKEIIHNADKGLNTLTIKI